MTALADMAARKAVARKAAFARRKAAHRPGADLTAPLQARLRGLRGRVIAGYMPIRTEIDPLPAMAALSAENRICVPVVQGPGQALVFHEWRPGCTLQAGAFGALVPADGAVLVPDTLIVPLLAFTPDLYRLGYGGGFYDRTLAQLRARSGRAVTALGFAYHAQAVDTLPLEATDQPLDGLVTEDGVIEPPV